jgi:hypothetical protein
MGPSDNDQAGRGDLDGRARLAFRASVADSRPRQVGFGELQRRMRAVHAGTRAGAANRSVGRAPVPRGRQMV